MKELFKKWLPDIIAIAFFAVISFAYFFPSVIEGRVIAQHDNVAFIGAGEEAKQYKETTGETTRWTNSIFGGMPTYQTAPSYDSTNTLTTLSNLYRLYLPNYVWLVFVMLLGFYILLRALKISTWLSILGAIIWAFSSYFFIIITAGHIWKFVTLAYIPPTIAGVILAYRGKYLLGGLTVAFFFALQIMWNHVQMTYYFLFVILFLGIAYLFEAIRNKTIPNFVKASGVLIVAFGIGASINLSNLYHTYEYSKDTMRAKSELVKKHVEPNDQTNSGLERSYITQWSYGIGETFSLLIPNVKGGASVPLSDNEAAMKKADPQYLQIYNQIPQYWGDQPGTSGPVYVGAFVCLLFVLGSFIVKGPLKWALLAATFFSILLSWGKNFVGLTDFFIDYIPMYSKFRTVASILVIAEFTIPLLAILALKEIVTKPEILKEKAKYLYVSLGLTGGLSFLFAVAPRMFFSSYISTELMDALQKNIPAESLSGLVTNLTDVCVSIFTADAWRSFFVIAIGSALLFLYQYKMLKNTWLIAGITLLCLADMWGVNKRYLSDKDFEKPSKRLEALQKTPTDEQILKDKTLDYRVLNLSTSTFNENNTAYWHKSVGGYHAAKLRRYQEMIEYHLSPEMQYLMKAVSEQQGDMTKVNPDSFKVINMLNTRYLIFPVQNGTFPLPNPYAYGNAWFVNSIQYVKTANEEIESLYAISPKTTAVVNEKYKEALGNTAAATDSLASIRLVSYTPNHLKYETSANAEQIAVFSEIYYKQWQAYIDGKEVPIACADYILRALKVPAGKHIVEFKFDPQSIHTTETIAYIGLALLLLAALFLIFQTWKKTQNRVKEPE
jgi:Bacterial membrane protein YfhO